jgi:hypothetical protein
MCAEKIKEEKPPYKSGQHYPADDRQDENEPAKPGESRQEYPR